MLTKEEKLKMLIRDEINLQESCAEERAGREEEVGGGDDRGGDDRRGDDEEDGNEGDSSDTLPGLIQKALFPSSFHSHTHRCQFILFKVYYCESLIYIFILCFRLFLTMCCLIHL